MEMVVGAAEVTWKLVSDECSCKTRHSYCQYTAKVNTLEGEQARAHCSAECRQSVAECVWVSMLWGGIELLSDGAAPYS